MAIYTVCLLGADERSLAPVCIEADDPPSAYERAVDAMERRFEAENPESYEARLGMPLHEMDRTWPLLGVFEGEIRLEPVLTGAQLVSRR